VTAAAAAGVEEHKIANVSRHKDLPVLRRYIRAATAFDDVGEVLESPDGRRSALISSGNEVPDTYSPPARRLFQAAPAREAEGQGRPPSARSLLVCFQGLFLGLIIVVLQTEETTKVEM
jgi:hypothetical protein